VGGPRIAVAWPFCGAPHDLELAGKCRVGGVKIRSGAFAWVLARMQLDESSRGGGTEAGERAGQPRLGARS
jgi:hypothetical protein